MPTILRTIIANCFLLQSKVYIAVFVASPVILIVFCILDTYNTAAAQSSSEKFTNEDAEIINVKFKTHEGYDMTGRIALPRSKAASALVMLVQSPRTRSQPAPCALEPVVVNSGSWTCPD